MKTELKIIKEFIKDKKPKTIKEISRKIKADYRITYTAAQKLIDGGFLLAETIGKSALCQVNKLYYGPKLYQAESERKEELLKNKNLNQLYIEIMSKLKTSAFILLIFGSYARGTQTKSSDIDLLFISNEADFESRISNILSLLPLKTHGIVFTEDEFVRMKDAKKRNVIQEAIENNIILYGIEAYYRLKNA